MTRRRFLGSSLGTAAALSGASLLTAGAALLPRTASARGEEAITATPLGDSLWMFQGAGANVVAAGGPDGLLLVDGGAAERSRALLRSVLSETRSHRVDTLLNTHWHWKHTGSNEALGKAGATIVAHENTKLWLGTQVISRWENRTYPPLPAKALPTRTFYYGTQHLSVGKRSVEYGHLPQAHTDGDIYAFFPDENVLVGGGVVSGGSSYPIADYCTGGWLGGMMTALKTLIARCDAKTRIVPGAGPLRMRADLEAQLDLCFQVLTRIGQSYYKGETWQQLLDSKPTREFDAQWGDPGIFLRTAYEGAWLHINEIRRVRR